MTAGLIVLMLGAFVSPASAAGASAQDNGLHVTKIIVDPQGPDLHFTVFYESSLFTRVFSMIFGARIVQPDIKNVFSNFTNVSLESVDLNNGMATLKVKNISNLTSDGWYVYDKDIALSQTADVIEVHNPDGKVITVTDTDRLPVITNRVPTMNKK